MLGVYIMLVKSALDLFKLPHDLFDFSIVRKAYPATAGVYTRLTCNSKLGVLEKVGFSLAWYVRSRHALGSSGTVPFLSAFFTLSEEVCSEMSKKLGGKRLVRSMHVAFEETLRRLLVNAAHIQQDDAAPVTTQSGPLEWNFVQMNKQQRESWTSILRTRMGGVIQALVELFSSGLGGSVSGAYLGLGVQESKLTDENSLVSATATSFLHVQLSPKYADGKGLDSCLVGCWILPPFGYGTKRLAAPRLYKAVLRSIAENSRAPTGLGGRAMRAFLTAASNGCATNAHLEKAHAPLIAAARTDKANGGRGSIGALRQQLLEQQASSQVSGQKRPGAGAQDKQKRRRKLQDGGAGGAGGAPPSANTEPPPPASSSSPPPTPPAGGGRKGEQRECGVCGKALHPRSLARHMREVHTGGGRKKEQRKCDVCGKSVSSRKEALVEHMRVHTGEKPHQCEYPGCRAAYAARGSLTKHMRTHTGEKPFPCGFRGCSKAFKESGTRTRHMRIHTGVKPYPCECCGAVFNDRSNLARHRRRHHGVKKFACHKCSRRFGTNSNMERHTKICKGVPYNN